MSTTNMPGFTAETSLCRTSGRYRPMAGSSNGFADGAGVRPQLRRQLLSCLGGCHNSDSDFSACVDICFWGDFMSQSEAHSGTGGGGEGGGGGGGLGGGLGSGGGLGGGGEGGSGQSPDPVCAKCRATCYNKRSAQWAACLANCNEFVC